MITTTQKELTERFRQTDEKRLSYSHVLRSRWNVLDLLNLFGGQAASTYVYYDIDMSYVNSLREKFKKEGKRITATAFLLKAISIAQEKHPESRTFSLPGLRTVQFNDIVAGFTVEREVDSKPVVFFGEIEKANTASLEEIAAKIHSFAHDDINDVPKLKEQLDFTYKPWWLRQIVLHLGMWVPYLRLHCMNATFGYSSLGALGVNSVSGPSVCTSVFGVGTIKEQAVVKQGKVEARPIMELVLCFDQRIMDAGKAAQFMLDIKKLVEGDLEKYI